QATSVSADINAKNLPTLAWVEWGPTTNYGSVAVLAALDLDYSVGKTLTLSNLTPGAVYHVRVVATNSAGTTYGHDLPFAQGIATPLITSIARQPGAQVVLQGI